MDINQFLQNSPWGGIKWTLELEKRINNKQYLESYGYKVYSQNDEDGIIQEIFNRIGVRTKTFIEFGVQNGIESNGHSLLLQGWCGVWIECDKEDCRQISRRFAPAINQGNLRVLNCRLDRDNVNDVLAPLFRQAPDLLSIDVDGNDWHIWNAINLRPRVVVIEYNGTFAPEIDWKMPYNEHHVFDDTDYFGASLKALTRLGESKGYQLVGTNIAGVNAFFVRYDLAGDKFPIPATAENLYNPLRLNMVPHRIGHRCKNYVGNTVEGMEGIFQYYPDWNSLASFGFYPAMFDGGKRRNLMKAGEARLFLRFIPEDATGIRVSYESASCIEQLANVEVTVAVGNTQEQVFSLKENSGYINVPLSRRFHPGEIVALDITINQLWNPSLLVDGTDNRIQGICITEIIYL